MASWLQSLCYIPWSCPEILLALVSFFLIPPIFNYKKHVPTNWPLVGVLPSVILNLHQLHDWIAQVLSHSGCTILLHGSWLTYTPILGTCDPANIQFVFCTNPSNFPKGSNFLEIFDIFGDGIFNSDSGMWQIQRKLNHTLISSAKFRQFMGKSCRSKVENGLMPVLMHAAQQGSAIDLQDVIQRFTFDSTYNMVFGTDPGSLSVSFPINTFSKAMDNVMEVLLLRHVMPESLWKLLRWLNIGKEKKMTDARNSIDHFIYQRIAMRREELLHKQETDGSGDLLTSCIDYQFGDGTQVLKSDKFLRDVMMNFMLAGRDAISAGLTWFFWAVSKNPSVENKILEELKTNWGERKQVTAQKPTVFDTEELSNLVFLNASLCETLRLFPPIPFEHKGVLRPAVLPSGEPVHPNTKIIVSLYAMGRMEAVWGEDCLDFKPERWISKRGTLCSEPSYKFMAFNAGPRTCLGKDISFAQMRAVAAAVLYNFHVEVVDGHPVSPKNSIILYMKKGLMVRIRERSA